VSIRTQGNTKYVGMRHALLDTVDWEVKIKIKLVNTSRLPTNGYKSGVGNLFSVAGRIEVSLAPYKQIKLDIDILTARGHGGPNLAAGLTLKKHF